MSNQGFRVVNQINRLDRDIIERLIDFSVANISDNMGRIASLDSLIKPFNESRILGSALTVKVPAGDNLMFHKALNMAIEGDIILVSGEGYLDRALCGEIMMLYAKSKGIKGFIVDGSIRDVDAIRESDFPVFAKGMSPNGPFKNGPGEINVPISIGGQVVFPGDIVIGDNDGIVVIRQDDVLELIDKTTQSNKSEEITIKNIKEGLGMDSEWIDKLLVKKGCEFI